MTTSERSDDDTWDRPRTFPVLDVSVAAVQIPDVVDIMCAWIDGRQRRTYIAVTGMHGVVEARRDDAFRRALDDADLVVPDGMPLVWLGRREGYDLPRRVYGPEVMETFCRRTGNRYRHFFYGGGPGIADRVAAAMSERFGVAVAGTISPPFRPLTGAEEDAIVEDVREARPDVLWIGLSTPKQERWMHEHRDALDIPVMVGVGAAFDFHAGTKPMAPRWMQEHGLEWLFRLSTEPRRLWRRYLVGGSRFVYWLAIERLRARRAPREVRGGGPR